MRWLLVLSLLIPLGCGSDDLVSEVPAVADTPAIADVVEPEDVPAIPDPGAEPEDVEIPWDLPETDLIEADPDIVDRTPEVGFDGCPTLGVSAKWEGTFEGVVTYDLQGEADAESQQGLFLVGGDLAFEIKCLDEKLLVSGTLSGDAEAAGRVGIHPFAAMLFGDFNYITRTIDAQLIDGEVRIYKVISVFFDGNFDGAVMPDGNFQGTWDGVHTGNDLGLEGTGKGNGKWTAHPVPDDG
jgi:hypothetical protein